MVSLAPPGDVFCPKWHFSAISPLIFDHSTEHIHPNWSEYQENPSRCLSVSSAATAEHFQLYSIVPNLNEIKHTLAHRWWWPRPRTTWHVSVDMEKRNNFGGSFNFIVSLSVNKYFCCRPTLCSEINPCGCMSTEVTS